MPSPHVTYADSPSALERGLAALDDLATVGVDVERADANRYYRSAALIQVGGQGRVVVLDPLAIADLSPLHAFLDPRTVVFHALENDLGPLNTRGVEPTRVEDTAIAAAMLGLATGLETLLRSLLGVELAGDKQAMQRADWEARPLTPDMLAYAAGDVADLPFLWSELLRRLRETGREEWYRQELAAAIQLPPVDERREWTRTRGAGRLPPPARARLRALWHTRERLARETDTAPGRIAGDKVLIDLATTPPTSASQLGRRGVRRQAIRAFGAQLMSAVTRPTTGQPTDNGTTDDAPRARRTPSDDDRARADRLRALRADRARALDIDPGVLCPSRTLLAAVLAEPKTPDQLRDALGLRPWQWDQVGDAFCGFLGLEGPGKPPPPAHPKE